MWKCPKCGEIDRVILLIDEEVTSELEFSSLDKELTEVLHINTLGAGESIRSTNPCCINCDSLVSWEEDARSDK